MNKFKYIYGIPGKPETNFAKVFTLEELEQGWSIEEVYESQDPLSYEVIARLPYTGIQDSRGVDVFLGDMTNFGEIVFVKTEARFSVKNSEGMLYPTCKFTLTGNKYLNKE